MKNTFCHPKANATVMNAMSRVNRWLNLKGIAFLKWIPILKHYPIVRGLCDITRIEWHAHAEQQMKSLIDGNNVVFIAPNHPEFYTDWMMDKEITARVAPEVASWATHDIVNGMGKKMQSFWLSNNLIAQIPGAGSVAKEFSVEYALSGKGVLLHPEGKVNWQSDTIAPLFSGVVDMAYAALIKSDYTKKVYILPITWKLSFNKNIEDELFKELSYIVKNCHLNIALYDSIELAMCQVIRMLLIKDVMKYNLTINDTQNQSIISIVNAMKLQLAHTLFTELFLSVDNLDEVNETTLKQIKAEFKQYEEEHQSDTIDVHYLKLKSMFSALRRLCELDFTVYENKTHFTQENIAEILKKIRIQYCTKGWLNLIHKFVPMPVSSRTAYVANPQSICLNDYFLKGGNDVTVIKNQILDMMRESMQETLDATNDKINQLGRFHYVSNPFSVKK